MSALHYAGIKQSTPLEVYLILLSRKANPNLRNVFGATVLNKMNLDAMTLDKDIVSALVKHGFDISQLEQPYQ